MLVRVFSGPAEVSHLFGFVDVQKGEMVEGCRLMIVRGFLVWFSCVSATSAF